LSITKCEGVTDRAFSDIINLEGLRLLDTSGCSHVYHAGSHYLTERREAERAKTNSQLSAKTTEVILREHSIRKEVFLKSLTS
jgi:hypothetical protein